MSDVMLLGFVAVILIAVGAALATGTPSTFLFDLIDRFSVHEFPTRRR